MRCVCSRFNPRTRVGCDHWATWTDENGKKFQSTHPCGVRHQHQIIFYWLQSFNPRTRVGCDREISMGYTAELVSIHAPVWGATLLSSMTRIKVTFQSTHPCGVRHINVFKIPDLFEFQSTHPCGVRPPIL